MPLIIGSVLLLLVISVGLYRLVVYRQLDSDLQAYPAIKVGKTTEEQLSNQIGEPYTSFEKDGYQIRSRKTDKSPYKPDLFYLDKDGVVVMKEAWYEPSLFYYGEESFIEDYGQPEKVLYDTRPRDVVTKALLYPTKGLAAFVHEDSQGISHIQYFEPMSLTNYLKTWGEFLGTREEIKPFRYEPDPRK